MSEEKLNIMGIPTNTLQETPAFVQNVKTDDLLMSNVLEGQISDEIVSEAARSHYQVTVGRNYKNTRDAIGGILFDVSNDHNGKIIEITIKTIIQDAMDTFAKYVESMYFKPAPLHIEEIDITRGEDIVVHFDLKMHKIESCKVGGYDFANDLCFITLKVVLPN